MSLLQKIQVYTISWHFKKVITWTGVRAVTASVSVTSDKISSSAKVLEENKFFNTVMMQIMNTYITEKFWIPEF